MRIIYKKPEDAVEFDYDRYIQSLKRYGEIDERALKEALDGLNYDPCHYSVLIELGVQAFLKDEDAKRYYEEHKIEGQNFLRLIRVTGYLTGDYRKANDGKLHEFAERTVNGMAGKNGVYSKKDKDAIEYAKLAYPGVAKRFKS